jgi:hypothetical protein
VDIDVLRALQCDTVRLLPAAVIPRRKSPFPDDFSIEPD